MDESLTHIYRQFHITSKSISVMIYLEHYRFSTPMALSTEISPAIANVLLISNIRAKLTNFGMARLGNLNPQVTHFTNAMCPGTDVYMPPEAVQDKPVYTEKINYFSLNLVSSQSRHWCKSSPNLESDIFTVNDPRYPPGSLKLCVPEIERRQNHNISQVDPNHPLLPIALDCLKDADGECPSAQHAALWKSSSSERNS